MLDAQIDQFIGAKSAPEAEQQQRTITDESELSGSIGLADRFTLGAIQNKPIADTLDGVELQGSGALFRGGMQGANAFEHLPDNDGARWVGKALIDMPAGQCCEAMAQRIDGQRGRSRRGNGRPHPVAAGSLSTPLSNDAGPRCSFCGCFLDRQRRRNAQDQSWDQAGLPAMNLGEPRSQNGLIGDQRLGGLYQALPAQYIQIRIGGQCGYFLKP